MQETAALVDAATGFVDEALTAIRRGESVSPGAVALWYSDRGLETIGRLPDRGERERAFAVLREMAQDTNADGAVILYDTYTLHIDRPDEFFGRIGGRANVAKYSIDEVVQMGFGQKLEALFCYAQMPRFVYSIKQAYKRTEDGIVLLSPRAEVLNEFRGPEVIFPDDPPALVLTTESCDREEADQ